MSKELVLKTRELLSMDVPAFAQLMNVDNRTVYRWELGEASPIGTALATISALQEVLPNETIKQTIIKASRVGGLGYLLVKLLNSR